MKQIKSEKSKQIATSVRSRKLFELRLISLNFHIKNEFNLKKKKRLKY